MRSTTRLLLGLALLGALAACGGSDDDTVSGPDDLAEALASATEAVEAAEAPPADAGAEEGDDADLSGLGTEVPEECPFTAEQVSELAGTPLEQDGDYCSFRDGVGVVTVTMASQLAAMTTYDYSRSMADELYDRVTDLDQGDVVGYVGVDDVEGQAEFIRPSGSYTISLTSIVSLDGPDGNESFLYSLLDLLPAG